jgi:signal transduction histidine kinase
MFSFFFSKILRWCAIAGSVAWPVFAVAEVPQSHSCKMLKQRNTLFAWHEVRSWSSLPSYPANDDHVNFGMSDDLFAAFIVDIKTQKDLENYVLCIDNTSLDSVQILEIQPDGKLSQLYFGGSRVRFPPTHRSPWHVAPLHLHTGDNQVLVLIKAAQKNINLTYQLMTSSSFDALRDNYSQYPLAYSVVVAFILLVISFAGIVFQRSVFVFYFGYVVSLSTWILAHYGYLFPLVYPAQPVLNEVVKPLSSLASAFFLLCLLRRIFRRFTSEFVRVARFNSVILRVIPITMLFSLVMMLPGISPWLRFAFVITWHLSLLSAILLIVLQPLLVFRTSITARIFLFSLSVIALMAVVQLCTVLGIINNWYVAEHGMTIASLLEFAIMSFGLFYSFVDETRAGERQVAALREEQAKTMQKLITVQEDERKRIAGDLHDNIGPLLAALKINFRRIILLKEPSQQRELVSKTEHIIDDAIAEIRSVAHNLVPKGIASKGLILSLMEYFDDIRQVYAKSIVFSHQIDTSVEPVLQMNIYRIVSELVLNAAKHSDAGVINILLKTKENSVTISVKDDGQGFDPAKKGKEKSLGLQSVESRVQYNRGTFELKTAKGRGTEIDILVPLQLDEA